MNGDNCIYSPKRGYLNMLLYVGKSRGGSWNFSCQIGCSEKVLSLGPFTDSRLSMGRFVYLQTIYTYPAGTGAPNSFSMILKVTDAASRRGTQAWPLVCGPDLPQRCRTSAIFGSGGSSVDRQPGEIGNGASTRGRFHRRTSEVDSDLFKVAPADIWKIQVLETWVAGERVYAKDNQSAQR